MARDDAAPNPFNDKDALLANVALLYYGEGLTQSEIAKRLSVSRPTIVNMLRECRDRGIVEIRVDGEVLAASTLSRQLVSRFGLEDAYVSRCRIGGNEAPGRKESLAQLARVAAMAVLDVVRPGDTVGVAWGETIKAVAEAMPRQPVDDVTVCQMIGSMVSDRVAASEDCAIRIANCLSASCYTLHAPAVLSSSALAESLRTEPTIATQLKRLQHLDVAIYSIGHTQPDTHLIAAGIAAPEQVEQAVSKGACGILCCRYIDIDGNPVLLPPNERVVAVEVEHLRAAKRKLVVIAGEDRLQAARAILNGKLATHLCVDEALAVALLKSQ
ncbi:sugar-binding transcriptional regulator [Paracoccus homiensis]|uniref:Putative sugar-binding domain-containing protein n=1 Tax=Paracoccus homiensis TaxID=364199 RepID=A0A1I0JKR3_9RHOB|nr:sugar-binding domain-containing protein [Paracoccus homiensis]SEU10123.1 Putative sugar-binding domain-containing protein [Paracoccus homiensis]